MNMIIGLLEERPFISYAAKKMNMSRSTIYRWMEEEIAFDEAANMALSMGHKGFEDAAEGKLAQKIAEGDMGAIKFYLIHNSERYGAKVKRPSRSYDHFGSSLR